MFSRVFIYILVNAHLVDNKKDVTINVNQLFVKVSTSCAGYCRFVGSLFTNMYNAFLSFVYFSIFLFPFQSYEVHIHRNSTSLPLRDTGVYCPLAHSGIRPYPRLPFVFSYTRTMSARKDRQGGPNSRLRLMSASAMPMLVESSLARLAILPSYLSSDTERCRSCRCDLSVWRRGA